MNAFRANDKEAAMEARRTAAAAQMCAAPTTDAADHLAAAFHASEDAVNIEICSEGGSEDDALLTCARLVEEEHGHQVKRQQEEQQAVFREGAVQQEPSALHPIA